MTIYQRASVQQNESRYTSRRTFITALGLGGLGLGLSAAIPNPVRNSVIEFFGGEPQGRYFRVINRDGIIYLEDRGRLYEVVKMLGVEGRGVDYLVRTLNPSYDRTEIETGRKLVLQLYKNPKLKKLGHGEKVIIHYDPDRSVENTIGHTQETESYPIPKQIGKGILEDLEELLKKK